MSVEIAWKQNILVTDFHLLKSLPVVFGFGSQAFVCGFSRQNINSVYKSRGELFSRKYLIFGLVLGQLGNLGFMIRIYFSIRKQAKIWF